MEVGSYLFFFLFAIIVIFFQIIGFLVAVYMAANYASRFGSMAGLGIYLIINCSALGEGLAELLAGNLQETDLVGPLTFLIGFTGYAFVLFAFLTYNRYRADARRQCQLQ